VHLVKKQDYELTVINNTSHKAVFRINYEGKCHPEGILLLPHTSKELRTECNVSKAHASVYVQEDQPPKAIKYQVPKDVSTRRADKALVLDKELQMSLENWQY